MDWLLRLYRRSAGLRRYILRIGIEIVRRFCMVTGDPPYRTCVRDVSLVLPVSHKLPIFAADYPFYDTLLPRLADFIRRKDGRLCMVDVGANVGYTIRICGEQPEDRFLAVEANPRFVGYLRQNLQHLSNCSIIHAVCGTGEERLISVNIESVEGTASVHREASGKVLPRYTLDELVVRYAILDQVNLVKIDTDGNDFDVLLSGRNIIASEQPAVLFECDYFNNQDYWRVLVDVLSLLKAAGYSTTLIYDNLGYLVDAVGLDDVARFRMLLFHQLVSRFGYYDVLVLRSEDVEEFLRSELAYFHSCVEEDRRFVLQCMFEKGYDRA